jgi:hypothetical protein
VRRTETALAALVAGRTADEIARELA